MSKCKQCGEKYSLLQENKKLNVLGCNIEYNSSSPKLRANQWYLGCECYGNNRDIPDWYLLLNIASAKEAIDKEYERLRKLVEEGVDTDCQPC